MDGQTGFELYLYGWMGRLVVNSPLFLSELWINISADLSPEGGMGTDGCMDGCMNAWMDGCMDGCMDRWMDGWMHG